MAEPWEMDWSKPTAAAPAKTLEPWEMDWTKAQEPAKPVEGGLMNSVKQGIGSTIKGAGRLASDIIPGVDADNAVTKYGQSVVDANPTSVHSLSDIVDKPLTAVAEAVGNAGGSVAQMMGTRAAGQLITAASPLAGPAAPIVAGVGQAISWLGPMAIAALPSYGGIRDKQIEADPLNEADGKSKAIAALGAATVGLIETKLGPQEWALAAMTKEGRAKLAEKVATSGLLPTIAKGVGAGALIEGSEELVQNPIEQLASYQDPTTEANVKDTLFSGAMGALGGGVVGGGVRGAQHVLTPPAESPKQPILDAKSVDEAVLAFKAETMDPGTAEKILAPYRGGYKDHTPEEIAKNQEMLVKAAQGDVQYTIAEDGTHLLNGAPLQVIAPQELPNAPADGAQGLTRDAYEAIAAINKAKGQDTVIYADHADMPDGFINHSNETTVFISNKTQMDPVAVAAHEVDHLAKMGEKQAAFVKAVNEELTEQATTLARERHGEQSDERLMSEIRGDIVGDAHLDATFYGKVITSMQEQLGDKSAELHAVQFLQSIKDLIGRVKAVITGTTFTTPNGERLATQYVNNLERVHDALAAAIADKFIQEGYRPPGAQTNVSQHLLARALEQQVKKDEAIATKDRGDILEGEQKIWYDAKPIVAPPGSSEALVSALAAAQKAPALRDYAERLNIEAIKAGVRMSPKNVHYVSDSKVIDGEDVGMAVAGPFDTREEADAYINQHRKEFESPQLVRSISGPTLEGRAWEKGLTQWRQGKRPAGVQASPKSDKEKLAVATVKDKRTGVELTRAQRYASLDELIYGDQVPVGANTQAQLGLHLQDLANTHAEPRTEDTPENREFVAGVIEHEARLALGQEGNAVGWYSKTTDAALRITALIYPEIATNADARFAYTYALAVTSNGATIAENVRNAIAVYKSYAKSGRMPEIGFGVRVNNMRLAFKKWNELADQLGVGGLRELMLGKHLVKDLKKINKSIKELTTDKVYGGTIIGSKIGGAFLQNLNGNHDAIAMDRWFMRMWGRATGNLVEVKQGVEATRDAPTTGSEKHYIRATMGMVLDRLKGDHPDLTLSDLQALLWYPEKDLYTMHGVSDESGKPTDYQIETARYAELRGVDRNAIEQAAGLQPDEPAGQRGGDAGRSGGGEVYERQASPKSDSGRVGRGGVGGVPSAAEAQRAAEEAADGAEPLRGAPSKAFRVGDGWYAPGPYGVARKAAEAYAGEREYTPVKEYAKVDPERARRIANAFNEMKHDPENPEVKAAYRAMIDETLAQWATIKATGLKVEFIKGDDPYAATPRLAILDVLQNNHLWVFPTDTGFGSDATDVSGNPLLEFTNETVDGHHMRANDVFRIVHDYFGHIKDGNGFRADGEENAWRAHAAMYSPLARRAMTAETRGQNSWVNFGPFGEANQTASAADTHYAPQKVGLLPLWASEDGAGDTLGDGQQTATAGPTGAGKPAGDGQRDVATTGGGVPAKAGALDVVGVHYSGEKRAALSGLYYGTGMKGADVAKAKASPDTRLHSRIYAYVNLGKGVIPEKYVGGQAHAIRMNNLYDANADVLDLNRGDEIKFESAVLDAGYDGYVARGVNHGVAVLLGDASKNVEVESRGLNYKGEDLPVVPAEKLTPRKQLQVAIATDKRLPDGEMTGATWKRVMAEIHPGVEVALDDEKVYYKDAVAKASSSGMQASEKLQFSPKVVKAWKAISKSDTAFRYPTSQAKDLASIVKDIDPKFEVTKTMQLSSIIENGWYITEEGGGGVLVKDYGDKVELDASSLKPGEGGNLMYHIVATYAHNNGKVFAGDRLGISDIAVRRRAENMISSALRYGTTKHLEPGHELTHKGVAGVKPFKWREGDDDYNLGQMLLASYQNTVAAVPEISNLLYNFDSGKFQRANDGSEFTNADFLKLASGRDARDAGVGSSTAKRAAVTGTVLRGTGSQGPALLDGAGLGDAAQAGLAGVQYSPKKGVLLAPNGKQSKLEPRLHAMVRTPAFKKWFGDWEAFASKPSGVWSDDGKTVSKVVDDNGEPLVVYHGTTAGGFTEFSQNASKKEPASFFSDDPRTARTYSGSLNEIDLSEVDEDGYAPEQRGLYPVFLNIREPNEVDFEGAHWDGTYYDLFQVIDPDNGDPMSAKDGRFVMSQDEAEALAESSGGTVEPAGERWESTDSVVRDAIRYKQDGAIIRNTTDPGQFGESGEANIFAVLSPNQVKSIENNGDFSAQRDSILKSPKITGKSNRPGGYTPGMEQSFINVGRTVSQKTIAQRIALMRQDLGKKLTQGIVDQFAPLKELSPVAYMLARLSKGSAGAFEAMLHHGKLSIKDGAYDADRSGGFIEQVGKPLQGEMHDFLWWVAAHRAEQLTKEDREHLFEKQDIDNLKSLSNGNLGFTYTLSNGQRTTSRREAFEDSARKYDAFNKNVLDIAEQSGLIKPTAVDSNGKVTGRGQWEKMMYVPFYRAVTDNDGGFVGGNVSAKLVGQSPFKKLKGGKEKLNNDLLQNVLANWFHLIDASVKNRAAKESLEAASAVGVATEANETTARQMARAGGGQAVWFMDEGEKRFFAVDDPFILTAITSLQFAGLKGPIMDALSTFKHYLTVGVTASPFFKVKNLIRDSVQAVATSDLSYNIVGNIADGIRASDHNSQTYVSALASGGLIRFGTMLEGKASARVEQLLKKGIKGTQILNTEGALKAMYNKFDLGLSAYNELGNRSEEITRSALYKQLTDKGVSHAEASLMARDLMDFSLQGSYSTVRFLTQVVPFMNARLQGLYKLGRAGAEDPRRMAIVLAAAAVLSISLLAAYGDDDEWKKREDWDRDNYWWFKIGSTSFRIPKPFEVGAVGTLAERGFEYFTNKEMTGERFRKVVLALIGNNLSMNPIPQAVKPILDVYSNKDSFSGRPIENLSMEKLKPDYRYTSRTSMLARAASTAGQAVTSTVGMNFLSPVQIDHMIRGYFGWLGALVVGTADVAVRPMTSEPTRPAGDLWKTATGGMIAELPADQSRYVSHMYEQAHEVEQAYGTYRSLLKSGKVGEAQEYLKDNREQIAKYQRLERVKKAEGTLNERIRMIERSSKSPEEKRAMIQMVQQQKDMLARRVY